ncbi:MAG: T9SS type A sorting domain-containing protein [Candidatus Neomarinimicrobiota bacterium]
MAHRSGIDNSLPKPENALLEDNRQCSKIRRQYINPMEYNKPNHHRLAIGILLVLVTCAVGQKQVKPLIIESGRNAAGPTAYPIPGSHLLRDSENELRKYLQAHPELESRPKRLRTTAWAFQVGDSKTWWATDIAEDSEYSVASTCRAIGDNCYIFVADEIWTGGANQRVDQTAVDSIKTVFGLATPADRTMGIFDKITAVFGDPPDVDSDPRIIILILDIKDGYDGTGGFIAGYFFSLNEYPDKTWSGRRSNEAEIYYLDADPADLASSYGLTAGMSTAAHEFQHMVHWNYDTDETTFINEGCATIAEVVCGYPIYNQAHYAGETDIDLFRWRSGDDDVYNDYSRAARWTLYLYEQYPNDFLKLLVGSPASGINGIEAALDGYRPTTDRNFIDLFRDWTVANLVNDSTIAHQYGYRYTPLIQPEPIQLHYDPNFTAFRDTVSNLAVHYITFYNSTGLNVIFNSDAADLTLQAYDPGDNTLSDVTIGQVYAPQTTAANDQGITFIVINCNLTKSARYSYSASGTVKESIELAYDDGSPEGFLPLPAGDSILVYFDGVLNATLDSIRIALRREGTLTAAVTVFAGLNAPSPIGTTLWGPATVTCSSATASIPYPVPYDNWVTVDLHQQSISAADFAVLIALDDSLRPGVMISEELVGDDAVHSYSYSQEQGRWLYWVPDDTHLYKYLIRAYVSTTGGAPTPQPTVAVLSANYPNPFNIYTNFRYHLSEPATVNLDVYNVSGQLVERLVSEHQMSGPYTVGWKTENLSSGVYIYRLRIDDTSYVKKCLLLK